MNTGQENLNNQPDKHPQEEGWRELKTDHSSRSEGASEDPDVRGDAWGDRDHTFTHTTGAGTNHSDETVEVGRMGNPTLHDESDFFEEENKGHTMDIRNEEIDEKHRQRLHERKHRHTGGNMDPGFGATDRG